MRHRRVLNQQAFYYLMVATLIFILTYGLFMWLGEFYTSAIVAVVYTIFLDHY